MIRLLKKVVLKLQINFFNLRLNIHGFLELPAQTVKERKIFKAIFDHKSTEGALRIFEWGSGFSTLYYGEYLRKKDVEYEWHSIDNNKVWHDKIRNFVKKKGLDANIKLHLMEFAPFWEKPGWGEIPPPCGVFSPKAETETGYINFPKQFNGKFNIIIIDARFRRHCIRVAKDVIMPGGIVVMHDAQKPHYHTGLDDYKYNLFINSGKWYPFQKLPNRVWIGTMTDAGLVDFFKSF